LRFCGITECLDELKGPGIPHLQDEMPRRVGKTADAASARVGTARKGAPLPALRAMIFAIHRIESGDQDSLVILGIYHGAQLRPGQEPR
jgi:hypothetical protein